MARVAVQLFTYRIRTAQRAFRKHTIKTQAQTELLVRQCQRDEKVLYPLAEEESGKPESRESPGAPGSPDPPGSLGPSGSPVRKHVPADIMWDAARRKLFERRRQHVRQSQTYLEALEVRAECEKIHRIMEGICWRNEADALAASAPAVAPPEPGGVCVVQRRRSRFWTTLALASASDRPWNAGGILWSIIKIQRKWRRQLQRYVGLGALQIRRKSLQTMEADLQMRARRARLLGRALGPIASSVRSQRVLRDAIAQNIKRRESFGGVVLDRAKAAYKAAVKATSGPNFRQQKRKPMSIVAIVAIMANMQRRGRYTEILMPPRHILMTSEEIRATIESGRCTMRLIDASCERGA